MLTVQVMKDVVAELKYWEGWNLSVYQSALGEVYLRVECTVSESRSDKGDEFNLDITTHVPMPLLETIEDWLVFIRWKLEEIGKHEVHEGLRWKKSGTVLWDPHDYRADKPGEFRVSFVGEAREIPTVDAPYNHEDEGQSIIERSRTIGGLYYQYDDPQPD